MTIIEQQEAQQTVFVAEFNEVKNELKNLMQLMGMMMRKLDSQVLHQLLKTRVPCQLSRPKSPSFPESTPANSICSD